MLIVIYFFLKNPVLIFFDIKNYKKTLYIYRYTLWSIQIDKIYIYIYKNIQDLAVIKHSLIALLIWSDMFF